MSIPQLTETMPLHPVRRPEHFAAVQRRLEGKPLVQLEGVPETETALREWHGGGIVWFISSGTAALQALLLGHEIGLGDEVVTTAYTWGATVSALLGIGAIPVFADIDRWTGLLDPASVARAITPRTRAILAVHLFGQPAPMRELREIAEARGLLLFEDGSQAHGCRYHGQQVGRLGHGSAFSCMGLKLLAGTEGGYVIFENEEVAERAFLYGRHPRGLAANRVAALEAEGWLDTLQLGWRPCVLSADLVRAGLPYLEQEIAARRRNAARLRAHLASVPGVHLPPEKPGHEPAWHLLSLVHEPEITGHAPADFLRRLRETKAGGFAYLPKPVHRMKRLDPRDYSGPRVLWHDWLAGRSPDYRQLSLPETEWRCRHSVEFVFNWVEDNPRAMAQLAACIAHAAGGA